MCILHFDGLVQERCNSTVLAMELCLSCINPSIWYTVFCKWQLKWTWGNDTVSCHVIVFKLLLKSMLWTGLPIFMFLSDLRYFVSLCNDVTSINGRIILFACELYNFSWFLMMSNLTVKIFVCWIPRNQFECNFQQNPFNPMYLYQKFIRCWPCLPSSWMSCGSS